MLNVIDNTFFNIITRYKFLMSETLIIRLPNSRTISVPVNFRTDSLSDLLLSLQKQTSIPHKTIQLLHNNKQLVLLGAGCQSLSSLNLHHEDIVTITQRQFMISLWDKDENQWEYKVNAAKDTVGGLLVFAEQKTGLPRQRLLLVWGGKELEWGEPEGKGERREKLVDLGVRDDSWVMICDKKNEKNEKKEREREEEKEKENKKKASHLGLISLRLKEISTMLLDKMAALLLGGR